MMKLHKKRCTLFANLFNSIEKRDFENVFVIERSHASFGNKTLQL